MHGDALTLLRTTVVCFTTATAIALRPRSVLLFNADDLGYGDLQLYGHPSSQTPNLNALGSEGIVLTSFYSGSPVCSPSRSVLLTGKLPSRTGVYCANGTTLGCHGDFTNASSRCCNGVFLPGMPGGLPLAIATLPRELTRRGWSGRSMAVGKWHLGMLGGPESGEPPSYLPTAHGFDEYYGVPHGVGACPCPPCFLPNVSCAIACSPTWVGCPVFRGETIVTQPAPLIGLSAQYIAAAVDFLNRTTASKLPFLLYYASHHTHSPQFADSALDAASRGRFGSSLLELDGEVGALLAALDTLRVAEETLVWFTSDNGPSLRNGIRGGSAGLFSCGKGTTYEGGVRVPSIVRWPAGGGGGGRRSADTSVGIAAGAISNTVISMADIFPTVISLLLGGSNDDTDNASTDGFDVSAVLTHRAASDDSDDTSAGPRNGGLVYYPQFTRRDRGVGGVFAARAGRYKAHFATVGSLQSGVNNSDARCRPSAPYVYYGTTVDGGALVYDLLLDPAEQWPLDVRSTEYAVGLARTTAVLTAHLETLTWWPQPMLNVGAFNLSLQPCARPGCTPFPQCCHT